MNRSDDGDFKQESRKAHYVATANPAKQEREREIASRLEHAMIMVEDEICGHTEAPPPVYDTTIPKSAGISPGEWAFIRSLPGFRRRFALPSNYWNAWTVPVIRYCGSFLLKSFRSPKERQRDIQREKQERDRRYAEKEELRKAAGLRREGTPFEKSPEERARISENMKATWQRRRAQGGKQSQ